MSIFVKASVAALQEQPVVNARIDGTDFVYHDFVDISVAVATPTGLVRTHICKRLHMCISLCVQSCLYVGSRRPRVVVVMIQRICVYGWFVRFICAHACSSQVVPVLRNCQDMSFQQVEASIAELGQKAKKV